MPPKDDSKDADLVQKDTDSSSKLDDSEGHNVAWETPNQASEVTALAHDVVHHPDADLRPAVGNLHRRTKEKDGEDGAGRGVLRWKWLIP